MKYIVYFCILILLLYGCDHGLQPIKSPTGFSGKIYYYNNWDSQIQHNKLVASKVYRKFNDFNEIFGLINRDSIKVCPGFFINFPFNVDSTEYIFELEPGVYRYIAIIQAYGEPSTPLLSLKWRIVGVYSDTLTGEPKTLEVYQNVLHQNIDIYVDFDNLPPQPFDTTGVLQ